MNILAEKIMQLGIVRRIIFIMDTSGSMDIKLLDPIKREIDGIARLKVPITVLYVDLILQGVQHFEPGTTIKLDPSGGWGTDFRPGFDHIAEQQWHPDVVVYFTDGICNAFPLKLPPYPVLWAKFGNAHFDPPFGEVILLTEI